jgi:hypothetical protein
MTDFIEKLMCKHEFKEKAKFKKLKCKKCDKEIMVEI